MHFNLVVLVPFCCHLSLLLAFNKSSAVLCIFEGWAMIDVDLYVIREICYMSTFLKSISFDHVQVDANPI